MVFLGQNGLLIVDKVRIEVGAYRIIVFESGFGCLYCFAFVSGCKGYELLSDYTSQSNSNSEKMVLLCP